MARENIGADEKKIRRVVAAHGDTTALAASLSDEIAWLKKIWSAIIAALPAKDHAFAERLRGSSTYPWALLKLRFGTIKIWQSRHPDNWRARIKPSFLTNSQFTTCTFYHVTMLPRDFVTWFG